MNDTGRLIAIVLIASFAIERLVAAVGFFIDRDALPPNARKQKIVLFFVAGAIAAVVIGLTKIKLLAAVQIVQPYEELDYFVTWLVLVGGADRIREFIGGSGGGSSQKPAAQIPPIQIVIADRDGKVTVTDLPPAS
jgi:hypothetical protein